MQQKSHVGPPRQVSGGVVERSRLLWESESLWEFFWESESLWDFFEKVKAGERRCGGEVQTSLRKWKFVGFFLRKWKFVGIFFEKVKAGERRCGGEVQTSRPTHWWAWDRQSWNGGERYLCEKTKIKNLKKKNSGSSMTDGSPLVSIRRSLARVRSEITGMDVRIGVVEHSLLQVQYEWRPIKGAVNCAIYMLMFIHCMFCSRETASTSLFFWQWDEQWAGLSNVRLSLAVYTFKALAFLKCEDHW